MTASLVYLDSSGIVKLVVREPESRARSSGGDLFLGYYGLFTLTRCTTC